MPKIQRNDPAEGNKSRKVHPQVVRPGGCGCPKSRETIRRKETRQKKCIRNPENQSDADAHEDFSVTGSASERLKTLRISAGKAEGSQTPSSLSGRFIDAAQLGARYEFKHDPPVFLKCFHRRGVKISVRDCVTVCEALQEIAVGTPDHLSDFKEIFR